MKKEELTEYIDSIQPDIYMKARLSVKIVNSKKNAHKPWSVIRRVTAFCLVAAVAVWAGMYFDVTNNVDNEENGTLVNDLLPDAMKSFIVVASASDVHGGATVATKTLEVDEAYPYGVYFKITDVRGMSEPQKKNLLQEMNDELNNYTGKEDFVFGRSSIVATDTIYMVICSINEFRFDIQTDKTLKSINVRNNSPYGQMVYSSGKRELSAPLHGGDITVNGEEFDPSTAGFYWDYTDELVNLLEQNPDTPFSAFDDVITFTVEFTDGSKYIGVTELNFDTYGNAAAVCKKYEYQKAGGK